MVLDVKYGDLAVTLKYLPEEGNPVSHSVSESKFQSFDHRQSYVGDSLPSLPSSAFCYHYIFLWNTLPKL